MRKIPIAATMAAVSLAVPSLASAAGNTPCTGGNLAGTVVNSNVTVPVGAPCDLGWADVKGNVDVYRAVSNFGATHFEGNVTVHPGGSFAASNWGVTIDKNLSWTDPATYSYNGRWGDYSPNVIKGQINYTVTSATNCPIYQAPVLYFNDTTAAGFNFSDQGLGQHRAPATDGLNIVSGH
jgi:hypothetical protein